MIIMTLTKATDTDINIKLSSLLKYFLLCTKEIVYNRFLLKRTLLDEMDYQSMKYQMKIYKDPATC